MSEILQNNPGTTSSQAAGTVTGPTGHAHQRLFYLHDLPDFKVHHDDTDVRGWDVKLSGGQSIGKVENLTVDKGARLVRYLEVTADSNFYRSYDSNASYLDADSGRVYDAGHDSHFLVPIGMATLDHANKSVLVQDATADLMGSVPRYRRGSELKPSYEVGTVDYYNQGGSSLGKGFSTDRYREFDDNSFKSLDDNFYTSGYFNSDRYYDRHDKAKTSASL